MAERCRERLQRHPVGRGQHERTEARNPDSRFCERLERLQSLAVHVYAKHALFCHVF